MTKTMLGRGAWSGAGAALAVLAGDVLRAGAMLDRVRTAGVAIAMNNFRDGIKSFLLQGWTVQDLCVVLGSTYSSHVDSPHAHAPPCEPPAATGRARPHVTRRVGAR